MQSSCIQWSGLSGSMRSPNVGSVSSTRARPPKGRKCRLKFPARRPTSMPTVARPADTSNCLQLVRFLHSALCNRIAIAVMVNPTVNIFPSTPAARHRPQAGVGDRLLSGTAQTAPTTTRPQPRTTLALGAGPNRRPRSHMLTSHASVCRPGPEPRGDAAR